MVVDRSGPAAAGIRSGSLSSRGVAFFLARGTNLIATLDAAIAWSRRAIYRSAVTTGRLFELRGSVFVNGCPRRQVLALDLPNSAVMPIAATAFSVSAGD